MDRPVSMTLRELAEWCVEEDKKRAKVEVVGDYVILDSENCPYEIELARIKNPQALLAWVLHLSEKNWVDFIVLKRFVFCVYEAKGWDQGKLFNFN